MSAHCKGVSSGSLLALGSSGQLPAFLLGPPSFHLTPFCLTKPLARPPLPPGGVLQKWPRCLLDLEAVRVQQGRSGGSGMGQ